MSNCSDDSDDDESSSLNVLIRYYDRINVHLSEAEMVKIVEQCEEEIMQDIDDFRPMCDIPSEVIPIHQYHHVEGNKYMYNADIQRKIHNIFYKTKQRNSAEIASYTTDNIKHKLSTLQQNNKDFITFVQSVLDLSMDDDDIVESTMVKDQMQIFIMSFIRKSPKQCYKALKKLGTSTAIKFEFWKSIINNIEISQHVQSVDLSKYYTMFNNNSNNNRKEGELESEPDVGTVAKEYFYILLVGVFMENGIMRYVFKIGCTRDFYNRSDEHMTSGQFIDITIVKVIAVDNASKMESIMKDYWEQHNITKRTHWTDPFSTELYKISDVSLLTAFINYAEKVADMLNNSDKVIELVAKNSNLKEENLKLEEEKLKMEEENIELKEYRNVSKKAASFIKTQHKKCEKYVETGDIHKIRKHYEKLGKVIDKLED